MNFFEFIFTIIIPLLFILFMIWGVRKLYRLAKESSKDPNNLFSKDINSMNNKELLTYATVMGIIIYILIH